MSHTKRRYPQRVQYWDVVRCSRAHDRRSGSYFNPDLAHAAKPNPVLCVLDYDAAGK